MANTVTFTINGVIFNASTVSIDTTLNTFLRQNAGLTGTKSMCMEGGCGVCVVTIKAKHPVDQKIRTWAAASCVTPIFSCHGYEITTIEGVGNRRDGYHEIQNRLAKFNGAQCGYCSPGMVMNMYSLVQQSNGKVTMADIENSFAGHLCRCTGYRSILDAFKTMASDADPKLMDRLADIEDLGKIYSKPKKQWGRFRTDTEEQTVETQQSIRLKFAGDVKKEWFKVISLTELFECLQNIEEGEEYQLVCGGTANGVNGRNTDAQVFIDINDVEELRTHIVTDDYLILGGGITLTETIDILIKTASVDGFAYLRNVATHIGLMGNVSIRNTGTLAGNLSIKYQNNDFCSDLFVLLESVTAQLYLTDSNSEDGITEVSPGEYLDCDMNKKIILNIALPVLDNNAHIHRSYKIEYNGQCLVASFLVEMRGELVKMANICFGGFHPAFLHATATEEYLIDKNLHSNETIAEVLPILIADLNVSDSNGTVSEYQKNVGAALFYKFVLSTNDGDTNDKYQNISNIQMQRNTSTGLQDFPKTMDKCSLPKNMPRMDGLVLAAGEVKFVNDLPSFPHELWAAFIPATVVHAKIININVAEVLKIPGVHSFYSARDIRGKNSFTSSKITMVQVEEEIFVSQNSRVIYNGQPCGIILADTFDLANYAATKVTISYSEDKRTPIFTSLDSIIKAKNERLFTPLPDTRDAIEYGTNTTRKITGQFQVGAQIHMTTEPLTTISVPSENGLTIYTSSQSPNFTKVAIAEMLNIGSNQISIIPKRIGGSSGVKITRCSQIACACALASHLTNRPVRFVMLLDASMSVIGKRHPCHGDYEVEIDDDGKIQRLKKLITYDVGAGANDSPEASVMYAFQNCYIGDAFDIEMRYAKTNTPSNTFCVGSGYLEVIAMMENILEHVAYDIKKDPIDVRLANMAEESIMKALLPDFITECHFYKRREYINTFNESNRWLKRGIAVVPIEYKGICVGAATVQIAVHHLDGKILVSHDCIEYGQGIQTKVAQVTSHLLGVPLADIKVTEMDWISPTDSLGLTGNVSTAVVCIAIQKACTELQQLMAPVRSELGPSANWNDVVAKCFDQMIDLNVKGMCLPNEVDPSAVLGVCCAEVEVDILSGTFLFKRVDILEDIGISINPSLDIVQIEAAFVFGMGYWLSETMTYDSSTGGILTNSTLSYKVPGTKDIPIDFRVKLLKTQSEEIDLSQVRDVAEATICMSVVTICALRYGIESARKDAGINEWFELGAPTTVEQVFSNSGNSITDYKLV